jgi:hypothetical protein
MDASSVQAHMGEALQLLGSLESQPKVEDWGTKVLFVYETLWDALDHDLVAETDLDTLVRLLGDRDILGLARNVIPELRDAKEAARPTTQSKSKARFMNLVQPTLAPLTSKADASDSAMYQAEKNAVYDADVYRTMLFLRRTERFDEKEMDDIGEWLEKCPVKAMKAQGAEVRDP